MNVIDKSLLRVKLNEFKTFKKSIMSPTLIERADMIVERFEELLASNGYFEVDYNKLLDEMADLKKTVERISAGFTKTAASER
ncbi:MAG: hypothetical protein FWC61_00585 [Proteobacteria bacterium]|nr:hypothetical protein [Pseudomonadota bacterium]